MDKFRNKLIKRRKIMIAIGFIGLTFVLFNVFYLSNLTNLPTWLDYELEFLTGLFTGLGVLFVIYTIKIKNALDNKDVLQKLYIEENDERKKYIRAKAGQPLLMVLNGFLIIIAILIGVLNFTISMTLIGIVLFQMIVSVIYKLYLLKTV